MRAPKTWRTWLPSEELQVEQCRDVGMTAKEIAAVLGRTLASVKCKLPTMDAPKATSAERRWLRVLTRPHTIAGAAAEVGVTKWAVKQAKRKLRRAGFEIPDATR